MKIEANNFIKIKPDFCANKCYNGIFISEELRRSCLGKKLKVIGVDPVSEVYTVLSDDYSNIVYYIPYNIVESVFIKRFKTWNNETKEKFFLNISNMIKNQYAKSSFDDLGEDFSIARTIEEWLDFSTELVEVKFERS